MSHVIINDEFQLLDLLTQGYQIVKVSHHNTYFFVRHGSGYYEAYFSNVGILKSYLAKQYETYHEAQAWFYSRSNYNIVYQSINKAVILSLDEINDLYIDDDPYIPDIPNILPETSNTKLIIFAIIAIIIFGVVMLI